MTGVQENYFVLGSPRSRHQDEDSCADCREVAPENRMVNGGVKQGRKGANEESVIKQIKLGLSTAGEHWEQVQNTASKFLELSCPRGEGAGVFVHQLSSFMNVGCFQRASFPCM